jgi:hypothetical protein
MEGANQIKINDQCREIRDEIQKFLNSGKRVNHTEICNKMKLSPATYWRRVQRVYEADRVVFEEEAKTTVASRTLRIREALEFTSNVNYEIANDPNQPAKDRRECSQTYFRAELWLYQLDTHGPNLPQLQDYVSNNVQLEHRESKSESTE